jgi:hypothetical protein
MMILSLAVLLCQASHAGKYTIEQLRANDHLPVFNSFYAPFRPEQPRLTEDQKIARLNAAAEISLAARAALPKEVPPPQLPVSAIPKAEAATGAVAALQRRQPMTSEQKQAVSVVADAAYNAADVDTLAQIALLATPGQDADVFLLVMDRLRLLRGRVMTKAKLEAELASATISKHSTEPLPEKAREWIASQLGPRVASRYSQP